jgi:hypothetical protein
MKLFTPLVFIVRRVLGESRFLATRSWGIKKHVQAINNFCDLIKLNKKGRQNLIILAKKNGKSCGLCD